MMHTCVSVMMSSGSGIAMTCSTVYATPRISY